MTRAFQIVSTDPFQPEDLSSYPTIVSLPVINVKDAPFNAKGDGVQLLDGVVTAGSPILNCASASFTDADIGKLITVGRATAGATGTLYGTIISRQSATQVTMSVNAGANQSLREVLYGSDDFTAIAAAIAAAPSGSEIKFPRGIYLTSAVFFTSNKTLTLSGVNAQGSRVHLAAGTAGTALLEVFNALQFRIEKMTWSANRLADYGIWLDYNGGGSTAISYPMFDHVNVLEGVIEGLRLASSLVNNFPIEVGTFIGCNFGGSGINVGIHSSNAVRHVFINCRFTWQGSYFQYAPTSNVWLENGGASFFGCTADQATGFDIQYDKGYLYVNDWYTESHKFLYATFEAAWPYPTTLENVYQNWGGGGVVVEWYKVGKLLVDGGYYGGDFYIGQLEGGSGRNVGFLTPATYGFKGTLGAFGGSLKNFDCLNNKTFQCTPGVQVLQSFTFEITNTGGTLQHRIMADANGGAAMLAQATINAINAALGNTPSVGAGVPFFRGAGINSLATHQILFDTINPQFDSYQVFGMAGLDQNTTGNNFTYVDWRLVSSNVNGVTQQRLALHFKDAAGATKALTVANIPAATILRVRFNGYLF